MSIQHILEDFAGDMAAATSPSHVNEDSELLESFEQGYKAGWEDAVRAKSDEKTHISAELARNLEDLSFTYHEAHAAILAEIAPVVEQAVMAVVPEIARAGFGMQVAAEITRLAGEDNSGEILLRVAAEDLAAVEDLLPETPSIPIRVEIDETLTAGQAQLAFGHRERRIDVTEIVASVGEAFSGLVMQAQKGTRP